MAGKPRLTKEKQKELVEDYQRDTSSTVEEIAKRHGVGKQTLYSTLRIYGITPGREHTEGEALSGLDDKLIKSMAQSALRTLIDDLAECRQMNRVLQNQLHEAGIDPETRL